MKYIFEVFLMLQFNLEWTENEIQSFREALQKYPDDWTRIAEYVHRDEQNCRSFYEIFRKKETLIDDEQV
mgnify:FL=1